MIRGPAVRGRAAGKMWATASYNSGFTRRSSLSLVAWPSATRSSVTAVAEKQRRNRLCPSRRFVNPRAVICHAALLWRRFLRRSDKMRHVFS